MRKRVRARERAGFKLCYAIEAFERRLLLAAIPVGAVLPQKVESNLAALYAQSAGGAKAVTVGQGAVDSPVRVDGEGRALVEVWTKGATSVVQGELTGLGLSVVDSSERYHLVETWLPVAQLPQVAGLDGVLSVTPVFKAITHAGSVMTQGDGVINGAAVRTAGFDGTDVRVGVMSDSAYDVAASQATGDLPPVVDRYLELGVNDEGRAMLEIVHDVAPGAGLAHHSAMLSEVDFAQGIRELASAGAKVIVDDVSYYTEPFFQDGIVARAVDDVTGAGVTYVSAAGNQADLSYESAYTDDGAGWHDFNPGGGVDNTQTITVPAASSGHYWPMTLVLQWDQPFYTTSGVTSDFDVYVKDASGTTTIASATTNNISTQQPCEVVTWKASGIAPTNYTISIQRKSGPANVHLKYVLYGPDGTAINEYPTQSGTVVGHAAAAGAIAVGAVPWSNASTIEPFSSRGDATIYFDSAGTRLATPQIRQKPDVVAPDGVSTTVSGFAPFTGTSAAAPHVAGVAALMLNANPHLTRAELYSALTSTAVDLGSAGRDSVYGFGRVDAQTAVATALAIPDVTGPTAALLSPQAVHGWSVDRVVVGFSEPMNPTSAASVANYSLIGAGSDGAFGTSDDVSYTLVPAYDNTAHEGTLTFSAPATRLSRDQYRLTLDCTGGLADPAGNALNGGVDQVINFTIAGKSQVVTMEGGTQIDARPDGTAVAAYVANPVYTYGWPQWKIGDFNAGGEAGPYWSAPSYLYADMDVKPTAGQGDVAVNASGGVAVMEEYLGDYEYYIDYQMLDATGRPVGSAKVVSSPSGPKVGGWIVPGVSMNAAGQFAVVTAATRYYESTDFLVKLRLFDSSGTGGDELDVSRATRAFAPAVACTPDGGAIVTWYYDLSTGYDGSGASIYARRYSAAGMPLGAEFRVNTTTAGDQVSPQIAAAADGSFVIVWSQGGDGGSGGGGAYFQRYSAAGTPVGSEVRLSNQSSPSDPHVDMAADGRFVITWTYAGQVFAQRYSADGAAFGTPVRVSEIGASGDSSPRVAIADSGDFVVQWTSTGSQAKARWIAWDAPAEVEPFGPWVVAQSPTGTMGGPLSSLTVTFNEAISPASFTASDVTLVAPGGTLVSLASGNGIVDSGDHKTFTINCANALRLAGGYGLSIGPNVLDLAGNAMDQNGDASQTDGYSGSITLTATPGSVAFNEGFEEGSTTALSGAWEIPATSGTARVTTTGHAGTCSLSLHDGNNFGANPDQSAVLHIDLSGVTDAALDFWGQFTGPYPAASVQASADGATWQTLATLASNSGWGHHAIALNGGGVAFGPDYRIRLLHTNGHYNSTSLMIDDVRITTGVDVIGPSVVAQSPSGVVNGPVSSVAVTFSEPVSALPPSAVSMVDPVGNSVGLSATKGVVDSGDHETFTINLADPVALGGHYSLVIGPSIVDVAGNLLAPNGALQGEAYSGGFDVSATAQSAPISESFEGGTLAALSGWSLARTIGTLGIVAGNAADGTRSLQFYYDRNPVHAGMYQDAILHMDLLNGSTPASGVVLDYWLKQISGGYGGDDFGVSFSVDGGTNWTTPAALKATVGDAMTYRHYTFGMDSLGLTYSHDVQIKFHHNSYWWGGFVLDGVRARANANPTVASIDAGSDPHNAGVGQLSIRFSEAVTGFDTTDLRLTRNGGDDLLAGSGSLTSSDGGVTWTLSGLSPITAASGEYLLHLAASGAGIQSADGAIGLVSDADATFYVINGLVPATGAGYGITGPAGSRTLAITAGMVTLTNDLSAALVGGALSVGSGAAAGLSAGQHLAGMTIGSGGAVNVAVGGKVLDLGSLSIAQDGAGAFTGGLDLNDGAMIVRATSGTRDSVLAAVVTAIRTGRTSGSGITSTAAGNDATLNHGLGVLTGAQAAANGNAGILAAGGFHGRTAGSDDVLVAYGWNGDLNMDGVVNYLDYGVIDNAYLAHSPASYGNGDANLDGAINYLDYGMMDNAFLAQNAPHGATMAAVAAAARDAEPAVVVPGASPFATAALARKAESDAATVLTGAALSVLA